MDLKLETEYLQTATEILMKTGFQIYLFAISLRRNDNSKYSGD